MQSMACDAIVMRHPIEGAAKYIADIVKPVVINAGDGCHAHPTQGLLDMFTILEKKKSFKGLKMAIIGDILYSRVARSNIAAWTKLGADVHVAGPVTLMPYEMEKLGVTVHKRVEEAIEGADVVDILRIQLERQQSGLFPTPREYARIFGVNEERMKLAKPDVMIMHPGPMNRGLEISYEVGYSDQAVIREQVTNGVAVRMALLFLTLTGGNKLKTLIKKGHLVDPSQHLDAVKDILVEDGIIKRVADSIDEAADETYDASGKVVAPGFIDLHTHLREPGLEAKEDIVSGTMAAAHGGITRIACMPNTNPVIDTSIVVSGIKKRAAEEGYAHVEVIGAITKGEKGKELSEMGDMAMRGAMAFSDDGHFVEDPLMMLKAARYVNSFDKALIVHAIEEHMNHSGYMHEGAVSARLGVPGIPSIAEDMAVARDAIIAEYTGTHVHIAHIASKGAVDIVRQAKKKGVPITCEVTVHHLTLTDEACASFSTATRVSPPLRSRDHVEALRAALKDGTIDAIVTDHAPHAPEEKDVEFRNAPNGFCGLETSVGVILTELYHTGLFTINEIVDKMSCRPAELFHLDGGTLREGSSANITILDLDKEWVVDSSKFYTRGKVTPFNGKHCKGQAAATMVDGVFVMKDGVVCKK